MSATWRVPVDSDGLSLPNGMPDEAGSTIVALQRACLASDAAARTLDGEPGLAGLWSGDAAQKYRDQRAALSKRCAELADVTAAAARLLAEWAPQALSQRDAMVRARAQIQAAALPDQTAAADAAWQAWTAAKVGYWEGIGVLAQRLHAVRDGITDRSLSLGDQVEGFAATVWEGGFAGPARVAWSLTGEGLVDPDTWRGNVTAVPGEVHDVAVHVAHDPTGAAQSLLDVPAWSNGHVGEGAGAIAVLFVPTPRWLRMGPEHGFSSLQRWMPDPHAPLPRLQTLDELIVVPALVAHEHPLLGHPLSRHVLVSNDYLLDRLTYGTVADVIGTREFTPSKASRFYDFEVADDAVAKVLRANENEIRAFARTSDDGLTLTMPFGRDLGVVARRVNGGFLLDDGQVARVTLGRTNEDQIYIVSAMVSD